MDKAPLRRSNQRFMWREGVGRPTRLWVNHCGASCARTAARASRLDRARGTLTHRPTPGVPRRVGTRGGHHCNAHDSGKFRAMKAAAKGASAAAGAPVLPLQLPPANSFAAMQRKRRAPAPGPLQRRRARLLPASFQSEN